MVFVTASAVAAAVVANPPALTVPVYFPVVSRTFIAASTTLLPVVVAALANAACCPAFNESKNLALFAKPLKTV